MNAQIHPMLGKFLASRIEGNKVLLSWQIVAGSTCNGIKILRSTDSLNYEQIGEIGGVCGDVSFAQNYDFTDDNPVINLTNYYRLELGNFGLSQRVSIILVDLGLQGYQVRPNPLSTAGQIFFENSEKAEHTLRVYNQKGLELQTQTTEEDFFKLNILQLKSGIYYFTIAPKNKAIKATGKFLVHQ